MLKRWEESLTGRVEQEEVCRVLSTNLATRSLGTRWMTLADERSPLAGIVLEKSERSVLAAYLSYTSPGCGPKRAVFFPGSHCLTPRAQLQMGTLLSG